MRKILEQRLERTKEELELCYAYEDNNYPCSKDDLLLNEINIYEHILKLLPKPRTEQEILKEFEKLGYSIENSYNHPFVEMSKYNEDYCIYEFIVNNKSEHNYEKYVMGGDVTPITMQEHKLLNELFTLWRC